MADNYPTFTPEELQNEIWKPIPGYEELYSVSNIGRVKRNKYVTRKAVDYILKQRLNSHGYLDIAISKDSNEKRFVVHRLVTLAFIGESSLCVNHVDGIKTNNRVWNLEYVTYAQNNQHSFHIGLSPSGERHWSRLHPERILRGESINRAKLSEEDVKQIKRMLADGYKIREIASLFKMSYNAISCIKLHKTWTHI